MGIFGAIALFSAPLAYVLVSSVLSKYLFKDYVQNKVIRTYFIILFGIVISTVVVGFLQGQFWNEIFANNGNVIYPLTGIIFGSLLYLIAAFDLNTRIKTIKLNFFRVLMGLLIQATVIFGLVVVLTSLGFFD